MFNKLDTLLTTESSLKATLAAFNRQWLQARQTMNIKLMRDLDRRCNLTEILLVENSDQIAALRADLEWQLDWIDAEGERVDNIRAAAYDMGDYVLWLDAENTLDTLAATYTDTLWDVIFAEHETIWGNEFAPIYA